MEIQAPEWLDVIQREYLDDYIRGGGAAVKFAVPAGAEAGRAALVEGLRTLATGAGFAIAAVEARLTRVHLVDRLFFEAVR